MVPTATGPTTPPIRTDLQGSTGPVGPIENPGSALKPTVSNRPMKAPDETFGIMGPPKIGTTKNATEAYNSVSFDFQVPQTPKNTTTEQGLAKRSRKRVFQPTSPSPILQTTADLLQ